MKKKKLKILIISSIILGLFSIIMIIASNYSIESYAKNKTYFDVSKIKKNKVGLVLGTAKKSRKGNPNLYFKYRINATVKLYKEKKVDFILVSGDNNNKQYDEPNDFKDELVKKGIPKDKIFLDYAGFRTLDSVVRAKKIFGLTELTIISQQFHNERAIYLAKVNGMKAIGFNAKDVSGRSGLKVKTREYLARTKVFVDIAFGVEPKFLGERVRIE